MSVLICEKHFDHVNEYGANIKNARKNLFYASYV